MAVLRKTLDMLRARKPEENESSVSTLPRAVSIFLADLPLFSFIIITSLNAHSRV